MTDWPKFAMEQLAIIDASGDVPSGTFDAIFDAAVGSTDAKLSVTREILRERSAQDARFGEQNHPDGTGGDYDRAKADIARGICDANTRKGTLTWKHILEEEVYEAFAEEDPALLRAELVQVSAVAAAWVEAIDRKAAAL